MSLSRSENRKRRHFRVRNKISGTTTIPRLNVFKSNSHFYAQIIDDQKQITLVSYSTLLLDNKTSNNIAAATQIGAEIAKLALAKKITTVVFDRGGYLYHGKVKAFADAARAAGLKF